MKLTVLLICACCIAPAREPQMRPFPMERGPAPADLSYLLEAPAGKDGFVRIKDGHFVKPAGGRFRIWGVNFVSSGTTPAKEEAPAIAAELASFGFNCVRFHFLDLAFPNAGLIDPARNDSRALNATQLDRLDFFVAELKKRGIYSNFNLNVGRRFKEGDGVPDYEYLGLGKGVNYFNPRVLFLHQEYARQLLTHFNPYTKSEYRREPALLMLELVNENSLVESWIGNRLLGKNTQKNPGSWTDITPGYEKELTTRYNAWLRARLAPAELEKLRKLAGAPAGGDVPRMGHKEFAGAPESRFRTEAAFYMDMEDGYFQAMRRVIKDELGAQSLIAGTSDHGHTASSYPTLHSASRLDIVDGHAYWQYPRQERDVTGSKTRAFQILNTPMVNDPSHSVVADLSRTAVAGKPYTVSEINFPFPNEYAAEGIPILSAYAAFQDWDGIFWYQFGSVGLANWKAEHTSHLDMRSDPVKSAQWLAGALMFLRGDVSPARRFVQRSYSLEQVYESLRLPGSERPYFTPGFPPALPLEHGSRIASLDGGKSDDFPASAGGPHASDTGELWWRGGNDGLFTLETERSQAFSGFLKNNLKKLKNLSAAVENDFCAITLSSLDGKPLSQSRRMLLTTGARMANTGMTWNEKRTTLTEWGTAPPSIEPVVGTVTLRNLERAAAVEVVALDGAGRRGTPVPAIKTAAGWELTIGGVVTPWYEIRVR